MNNALINEVSQRSARFLIISLGVIACICISLIYDFKLGIAISLVPIIILSVSFGAANTYISLTFLFVVNYFIMGLGRYINIPIPITNIFDLIFAIIFTFIIIRQIYRQDNFNKILNIYTVLTFIWMLYCIINLGNNVTGEINFEAWLRAVRPLAIYPFLTCIIISISCKHYSFIQYFLILLAILTILGALKGIWQKRHGFDSAEYLWVTTRGASTHLIYSGIRYFSFFTDAANFGCSMGFSCIVLSLSSLFIKNKIIKILFLFASALAVYGLLIAGTRAAIAVPFAGLALFTILAKNWKLTTASAVCFIILIFILNFTTIGNNNQYIRRIRTAFDTEDASFQVRLENQKALKAYMSETPFGIGISGVGDILSPNNKFYFVSICPADSDLVNIWIRTGVVGLTIYLIIQFFIYSIGSYILLFKIKNPEIRGPLTAMLCGCAGLLVASYANMINFQFPNGLIVYTCLTLVFIGPYLDKQYTIEHDKSGN